jgi:hypothetical protein
VGVTARRGTVIAHVGTVRRVTDFSMSNTALPAPSGVRAPVGNQTASIDVDYRIQANVDPEQIPDYLRKNCVLFYTNDMEDLAKRVAAQGGGNIELGKIRWK